DDPEVEALIERAARDSGTVRRPISSEEIIERTMYALVNEGARILDEGRALRASDIDLVYINGYGFPSYRGGPMHYADDIGLGADDTPIRLGTGRPSFQNGDSNSQRIARPHRIRPANLVHAWRG